MKNIKPGTYTVEDLDSHSAEVFVSEGGFVSFSLKKFGVIINQTFGINPINENHLISSITFLFQNYGFGGLVDRMLYKLGLKK